jgi:hypothetical protein
MHGAFEPPVSTPETMCSSDMCSKERCQYAGTISQAVGGRGCGIVGSSNSSVLSKVNVEGIDSVGGPLDQLPFEASWVPIAVRLTAVT